MADRTVAVNLIARVQGYVAGLGTAGRATAALDSQIAALSTRSPAHFQRITGALTGVGVGLAAVAGYAVYTAAEFDKRMSEVAAVSGATGGELRKLREAALEAGKTTSFSAKEAASAEAELAKAGISTANILGGALKGALTLAAAGSVDLSEAADVAAKTMNIFGLSGQNVTHIADVLSASANKSATDVHQMGMALRMAGLVAAQTGLSMEQTVGVLSAFADRALVGSDAGTSLKVMLQKLANPSKESAELMQQLGIAAYDATGKFVGIDKLAQNLQDSLGGLTQAQRDAAMAQIFGSDAVRAANVLYSLGAAGVQKYTAAVDDQGAAARTAAQKTDNLVGDLKRLQGQLEAVAIESSGGATSGLRFLVQGLTSVIATVDQLPGGLTAAMVATAGLVGVMTLGYAAFVRARAALTALSNSLIATGAAGEVAAAGLYAAVSWISRISLVIGGLILLSSALDMLDDKLSTHTVKRNIDELTNSLKGFAESGKAAGELARTFGSDMSGLAAAIGPATRAAAAMREFNEQREKMGKPHSFFDLAGRGMEGVAEKKATEVSRQQREDIEALDKALTNLVTNGNATQAKLALMQMADAAGLNAAQFQQLVALLPGYNAAAAQAGAASAGTAQGFGTATTAARTLSASWADAVQHGQSLSDLFNELNGAALGWAGAEVAVEDSLRGLTGALRESNGSLDVHTEKGGAAKRALLDYIGAINKAVQAKYDETGSLEAANGVYQQYRGALVQTLVQSGVTRAEAERLAGTYMRMPDNVRTQVSAPGATRAEDEVHGLDSALRSLRDRTVRVNIYTNKYESDVIQRAGERSSTGRRWGGITQHAAAGLMEAQTFVGSGTRYAFAEAGTGGEAFIPRLGNLSRSRGIAERVVTDWLGGSVRWTRDQRGGGGPALVANITVNAGMGTDGRQVGAQIIDAITTWEQSNGTRWRTLR